jgi:hypothetical protein
VQDELRKLSAIGLITNWSNGYHRFYRAHNPAAKHPEIMSSKKNSTNLTKNA